MGTFYAIVVFLAFAEAFLVPLIFKTARLTKKYMFPVSIVSVAVCFLIFIAVDMGTGMGLMAVIPPIALIVVQKILDYKKDPEYFKEMTKATWEGLTSSSGSGGSYTSGSNGGIRHPYAFQEENIAYVTDGRYIYEGRFFNSDRILYEIDSEYYEVYQDFKSHDLKKYRIITTDYPREILYTLIPYVTTDGDVEYEVIEGDNITSTPVYTVLHGRDSYDYVCEGDRHYIREDAVKYTVHECPQGYQIYRMK